MAEIKAAPEAKPFPRLTMRYARPHHMDRLSAIDLDCFGNHGESLAQTATHKVVVAYYEGKIAGYIIFDVDDDHLYVARLGVAGDARKQRICGAMISWLIRQLQGYRRHKITLVAFALNGGAARKCYARVGFERSSDPHNSNEMVYVRRRQRQR